MFPTLLVAEDNVKNTTIKQYDYWSLKCEVANNDQNCRCTLHKEIVFSLKIATIIFFREQCRDAASR